MAHVYTINPAPEGAQPEPSVVNLDQSDVGGTVEADDEFGDSVAALGGNDEYGVTFAFSAPGENNDAGVVNTSEGLTGTGVQDKQGSAGVPGQFRAGDRFGEVITFAGFLPVDDDDNWYLYVGAPGDLINGRGSAGSVTAVANFGPSRVYTQTTAGVPGTAEAGDRFGASLTSSEVPPLPNPRTLITEAYPGTPGVVQAKSRFGSSIAGLPASDSVMVNTPPATYGEAAFAISSPFQAGGSVFVLSNDPDLNRSWKSGTGGVGGTGVRFGQSVA